MWRAHDIAERLDPHALLRLVANQNRQGIVPDLPAMDAGLFLQLVYHGTRFTIGKE